MDDFRNRSLLSLGSRNTPQVVAILMSPGKVPPTFSRNTIFNLLEAHHVTQYWKS